MRLRPRFSDHNQSGARLLAALRLDDLTRAIVEIPARSQESIAGVEEAGREGGVID